MLLDDTKTTAEDRRKAMFLAVVQAQDEGMTVVNARKMVAKRFDVSESDVRKVELEGVDKEWPPL